MSNSSELLGEPEQHVVVDLDAVAQPKRDETSAGSAAVGSVSAFGVEALRWTVLRKETNGDPECAAAVRNDELLGGVHQSCGYALTLALRRHGELVHKGNVALGERGIGRRPAQGHHARDSAVETRDQRGSGADGVVSQVFDSGVVIADHPVGQEPQD